MKRLKKHAHSLHVLSRGNQQICKAVIQNGDKDLIKCLCEISHNILKGNVPVTSRQKKKLNRFKNTIRQLTNKRQLSLTKKKQLLQKGGFLGTLLGPIIGLLGSLLNS